MLENINMPLPLVSVIIPCYNQGIYLSDALDSILKQSFENWECIIVDDGSVDNTKNIAIQYCKRDQRFIYIYKENAGLSAARNTGVNNSQGEYILPLDSDDKIAPQYIELALQAFRSDDNIKIVYCRAELFGIKNGEWKLPEFSMERMLGRNCIFCSALYKRSDFNRAGGYKTSMKYGFEDWDFWLSILQQGGNVYQIDKVLFFYRIRKKSMLRLMNTEKLKYSRRKIWENHKNLYAEYLFDPTESFEYKNLVDSRLFRIFYAVYNFLYKILYRV